MANWYARLSVRLTVHWLPDPIGKHPGQSQTRCSTNNDNNSNNSNNVPQLRTNFTAIVVAIVLGYLGKVTSPRLITPFPLRWELQRTYIPIFFITNVFQLFSLLHRFELFCSLLDIMFLQTLNRLNCVYDRLNKHFKVVLVTI